MSVAIRNGSIVLLLAAGLACQDPAGPWTPADDLGRVQMAFQSDLGRWRADPLVIDSASIRSDVLHVYVTHGGGCARHEYAAVAWNGWLESHPVQVGVVLAHDSKGDACDAIVRAALRFDLAPLRQAYARDYGMGAAEVVLRLSELYALNRAPTTLRYSFR